MAGTRAFLGIAPGPSSTREPNSDLVGHPDVLVPFFPLLGERKGSRLAPFFSRLTRPFTHSQGGNSSSLTCHVGTSLLHLYSFLSFRCGPSVWRTKLSTTGWTSFGNPISVLIPFFSFSTISSRRRADGGCAQATNNLPVMTLVNQCSWPS